MYCYFCAKPSEKSFHTICAKKLFGKASYPSLTLEFSEIQELAKQNVLSRVTVPGVQPKISLELKLQDKNTTRLTIVGFMGDYILKPPSLQFQNLPENEHLTMLLAKEFGIDTAISSLIPLKSGELSFLSKRFDRYNRHKLAQEDFCQLSERLTEDKYKGSYEGIAKLIRKYTNAPGIETVRFFELVVFSYLTGNSDMHLKNFSLLTEEDGNIRLAPAYDLLSIAIFHKEDPEELALSLNGKKNKIQRNDILFFGESLKIHPTALGKILERIRSMEEKLVSQISNYPFCNEILSEYSELIRKRYRILFT
ncbi:HipA domain-containing protein [Leptospira ilyithenensis]|uniref:Type II toxin-antitoxin system HipA family toxin n=1 Tax=Leptospira ilyithenensis TaxID=2484901 RepID=A0A4R9LVG1_9LEPT|nr:HipA domain-containing protein [Leptospira ilyithenensis]TGN14678.1 type II toxin-antitoxin system HipA family toxin [Leptospira ilyithenensis]